MDSPLHASTIREHVCSVAQRLENELGEEQWTFVEGCCRAALETYILGLSVDLLHWNRRSIVSCCIEIVDKYGVAEESVLQARDWRRRFETALDRWA